MDAKKIEMKWQKKWEDTELYKFDVNDLDNKFYMLEMFSYPSGANLHIGHWYNYAPSDSYARYKMLQGYNLFHPQGFDSFGLPAENYAILTGVHPQDSTLKNIETMEKQLKRIGATYDWDYELSTCSEDYYKWTQWLFLKFYEKGLAYRKKAPVNWCESCNTVLANEQVVSGECERCGTLVKRKKLTQWFFKITDYTEELLSSIDTLDWPEKTKAMQRNWIGKSVGGEVVFELDVDGLSAEEKNFSVFTTRADTLFGSTYVVFAPEHPLVEKITKSENMAEVVEYQDYAAKASEIDRMSTSREKTGVFTGSYAINPINDKKIPIYISDYVLATYGTGIVMAVPAHDERDFEFATKFGLDIVRVIQNDNNTESGLPYCDDGSLVNSGEYTGMNSEKAREEILSALGKNKLGGAKVNYRLRDWLVSRQRYWGAPIPIVYCPEHGEQPVPLDQLPIKLPYNVDFTPDGQSPLRKSDDFINTTCPICGGAAKRDVDTMDTFVCSSWYFLRFPSAKNDEAAFDKDLINKMMPVDLYVGGAEHAVMHLLYARFFVKALRDMGYLKFDEPFNRLIHQGTILGPDGQKMSKSKFNVINPDDYINIHGSDVFRMYLEFGFSYIEGGPWSDSGIKAVQKFLERIERIVERSAELINQNSGDEKLDSELNYVLNYSIKHASIDIERMSFNTAIARLMELVNAQYKYLDNGRINGKFFVDVIKKTVLLLSPFAPHWAEEFWEMLGENYSVFNQTWPVHDEEALVLDEIEYAIQVNGKIRARIQLPVGIDNDLALDKAMSYESVSSHVNGKTVVKVIVIKNIVNIVVK